jgi:hypothetical protein
MDEQFDNKLTNHIREVFDNYEHPGTEHGWEQLRKKFPAEKKRNKVAWLWWSTAAAIAVVFLGLGIWYNNQGTGTDKLVAKNPVKQQQQQPANKLPKQITDSAIKSTPLQPDNDQPVIAKNNTPAFNNTIVIPTYTAPVSKKTPADNIDKPIDQNTNAVVGHPQPIFNNVQPAIIAQIKPVITPSVDSPKLGNNLANQSQMASVKQPDAGITSAAAANTAPNSMARQKPAKTIDDMFADDKLRAVAKNKKADDQVKKVNFSVYAATYFNYAEGSTNQINAGAGITSDFRLSRKLKLSTGVALAQNTLNYNSAAPSAANSMMAAAPALKQEALFATTAVLPVFKNYSANLVGLDIPINIKYEFNPQKNDTYISAGLSSGTFIDENYTYNYTYSNGASSTSNAQDQQTSHNSFNNFYFAKMLNLSFGVGYPVGGNRLIVEPFVKYPLGGLGAQDIRFGAGGVNLKFSFKTKKK